MVKVAVAGGTGNVATELLREPIASGKHDITILTRKDPPTGNPIGGVSYKKVDYSSVESLTEELRGYDVCLSFLIIMDEAGFQAQKNLIDACVAAGVKKFAPTEWGIKTNSGIRAYAPKDRTAAYLSSLNTPTPKLNYCLFHPSIWMDYFAHPYPLSPNLITWPFFIDPHTRHAILFDDEAHNTAPLVVTAISDVSYILALALDDASPWPSEGGIRGARTSIAELFALAQRIRGGEWHVERVKLADLEAGNLTTRWIPEFTHPAIPEALREGFSREFVVEFMKAVVRGAWDVGDEWNRRFPGYRFKGLEEYLVEAWRGRE
ncbi:NmrA-like family protein-like protein [Westerdykella ornata]|uniref:NmrA-like family protein-like protein n=1 Tax=Westerdykella ornata TaxID=318751 RepID=A0A6A6JGI5_WESOR|nr:NmrA-like family protein-like protein [Westerdykella ornata]KAF2275223.1 NmrA-like family protein-like protein [Westerdykella ornata]